MATLKVYSREYGERRVKETIHVKRKEIIIYTILAVITFIAIITMLNYQGKLYSLRASSSSNNETIQVKEKDNNEQQVEINNLSSYERVKGIAESLGMKTQKDNIKVVR